MKKILFITILLLSTFLFKINASAVTLRAETEYYGSIIAGSTDDKENIGLTVMTWLAYTTQNKDNLSNENFYLIRKFVPTSLKSNNKESEIGNGEIGHYGLYNISYEYKNGSKKEYTKNELFKLEVSSGYSPKGAYTMKYNEKSSNNEDLPEEFYACLSWNPGFLGIGSNYELEMYDNSSEVNFADKYKESCTNQTNGRLIHYKRSDMPTYKLESTEKNKIVCEVDNSSVSFIADAENLKFYIVEHSNVSNLQIEMDIQKSPYMATLFSEQAETTSFSSLRILKFNKWKEITVSILATAAVTLTTFGIANAVVGTASIAAKFVGFLYKVTKVVTKMYFAAEAVSAGVNSFSGSYLFIGSCTDTGCTDQGNISGYEKAGQCYISKADNSYDFINIEPTETNCEDITSTKFYEILNYILRILRAVACILLIVFGVIDFIKPIVSSDADLLKKSGSMFIKRLILTIIIFFIPAIIDLLLKLIDQTSCGLQ